MDSPIIKQVSEFYNGSRKLENGLNHDNKKDTSALALIDVKIKKKLAEIDHLKSVSDKLSHTIIKRNTMLTGVLTNKLRSEHMYKAIINDIIAKGRRIPGLSSIVPLPVNEEVPTVEQAANLTKIVEDDQRLCDELNKEGKTLRKLVNPNEVVVEDDVSFYDHVKVKLPNACPICFELMEPSDLLHLPCSHALCLECQTLTAQRGILLDDAGDVSIICVECREQNTVGVEIIPNSGNRFKFKVSPLSNFSKKI